MTTTAKPELIPFMDAVANVGVSLSTIERLIRKDPSFPRPIRLGARRFYRPGQLESWLSNQIEEAQTKPFVPRPRAA